MRSRLTRRLERAQSRRARVGSVVQAISAASCADGSIVIRTGSPSRGKTAASNPFIPQKFVR
jgi:chloramphenicol 3-O-phosphotransferase